MVYLSVMAGLVLLVVGGEALVRGAVTVARRLGVSPLLIGLTLVGFGTSTPELVASLRAALAGSPGIAVGNVVGSNIVNILLILGIVALVQQVSCTAEAFRRDGTVFMVASVLLVAVFLTGEIGRLVGLLFLALLIGYTVLSYLSERTGQTPSAQVHLAEAEEVPETGLGLVGGLAVALAGIVGVLVGAGLLVSGAITLARTLGVSEAVIGLTLVAVGTSLPELAASVMAAIRRHADVAFGNVVGSNIFNILGIMGTTALVTPVPVPVEIVRFDGWVMLAVVALFVAFATTGWRISRWEGLVFLAAYGVYLTFQASPTLRAVLGLG